MTTVQRKQIRISKGFALAAAVLNVAILGTGAKIALSDPPTTPAQATESHSDVQGQSISGEVQGYNLDPRGNYSSIVIKDGDHLAQLDLPSDAGTVITAAAPIGQTVQATGLAEVNAGDRVIYRLLTLTGENGQKITLPSRDSRQQLHVEGSVKQINFSRRGDVDGVILDSGDFVHVDPHSAASLNFTVGEKIIADGLGNPMLSGHNVIDATKVNDTTIERPERGPRDGMRQHGPDGPGHFDGEHGPDRDGPPQMP